MKKSVKILVLFAFVFILNILNSSNVYASEASVYASNCNVGETFTVTVNIPQDAVGYNGTVTVTYSDGSTDSKSLYGLGWNSSNNDLYWPGNANETFTAKVAGNATVSVTNLTLTNSVNTIINSNKTLTTALTISNPAQASQPPSQANNSGSGNSGNASQEPTPNLNFSETNEKMYTSQRVNVRQGYGTSSSIIQTLQPGTEVTRTGVSQGTANGYSWSRVSYNGVTGYLITGALVYEAPEEQEKPEENQNNEEKPDEEKPEENQDNPNDEALQKISKELGTIPEVGINISVFMFIGAIVTCFVMMYEVKKDR